MAVCMKGMDDAGTQQAVCNHLNPLDPLESRSFAHVMPFHTPVCVFESPTHDFETMTNISTDTTFYQIPTTRLLNTEPVVSYAQLQAMREECDVTPNNTRNVYLTDEELKDILECYQSNMTIAKDSVVDYFEGSDSDYSESF